MIYTDAKFVLNAIMHNAEEINNKYFAIDKDGICFFDENQHEKHLYIVYRCAGSSIVEQVSTIQQETGCSKEAAAAQVVDILYGHMSEHNYSSRTSNLIQWLHMLNTVYKLSRKKVSNKYSWVPYKYLKHQLLDYRLAEAILIERQIIEEGTAATYSIEATSSIKPLIHFWERR